MILFLKKNIYAIKFILLCFNKYKIYKYNNLSFILKIYLIKVFFSYNYIRKKIFKIKNINFIENDLFDDVADTSKIINKLTLNGISDKLTLKNYHIQRILEDLNNSEMIYDNKSFYNIDELTKYGFENNLSRILIPINLNKNKNIFKIITSKFFENVTKGYLNTNKFSLNCSLFISFPKKEISNLEKISSAQMFHFDSDFSKFLKLYVYLSKVDENNGPHAYVEKTHFNKLKKHELQKGYSDKQIKGSYDSIKVVMGEKGTIFFEDSFGLHKGESPKNQCRLMLNIHYGNSNLKYSEYDKYHDFNDQIIN